jgi:hypothetical protein
MSSMRRFVHLRAALFLSLSLGSVCLHAAELSPEERLKAIRSALIEAAMKSNTRVTATSWMDSDGALRELNRFSSEIKIRELQVRNYSRDDNQEPQADMVVTKSEVVPANRCDAPQAKAPLMHVMSVGMDLSPSLVPTQRYAAQQVGRAARARLLDASAQAKRWRLMTDPVYSRSYDRQMFSHGEEHVQWHLQLTVGAAPAGVSTDDLSSFALMWQIRSHGKSQVWYSAQDVLLIAPTPATVTTPQLDSDTQEAIAQAVERLTQQLDKQLGCEPQSFAVEKNSDGHLILNAGGKAGLRVGDKLMLADARVLPKHALEAGSLDAAVLAEVKSVTAYQAQIKQIAGRPQKFQGAWVAWPYTY